MTMNRDGSDQRPFLVGAAPVAATITAAWAPSSRLAAVAGLDCGDGIRQWGIYVLDFSGACSSAASDLEAGNPNPAREAPVVVARRQARIRLLGDREARRPRDPHERAPELAHGDAAVLGRPQPERGRVVARRDADGRAGGQAHGRDVGQRLQHLSDRRRRERRLVVRSVRLGGRGVPAHRSGEGQRTQPGLRRDAELATVRRGRHQDLPFVPRIAVGQRVAKPPPSAAPAPLGLVCGQVAAGSDLDTDYYGSTGFRPGDTVCSLLVSNAVVKSAFLKALAATGTHIDIARFTVSMAAAIAEALRPLPKAMLDGVFKALVPQVDFSNQVTASAKALLEKALALLDPVLAVVVTAKGFVDAMVKVASVVGLVVKAKETYVALTTYNACLGLTWGVRNGETGKVNGPLPHGAGKPLPWMTSRLDQYATLRTTRRQAFWALPLECTTQGTVARSAGGRNAGIVFSRYGVALLGTLG